MKRLESAGKKPRSSGSSPEAARFVVCVSNEGCPVSLELRKICRALPDASAEAHRLLRVIDESGADCLYPRDRFLPIEIPSALADALRLAS